MRASVCAVLLCITQSAALLSVTVIKKPNMRRSAVTEQQSNKISSFYSGPGKTLGLLYLLYKFLQLLIMHNAIGDWTPTSWLKYPIKQPPNYPDATHTDEVVKRLSKCSPLVFAGEVRTLQEELAKASLGQGIISFSPCFTYQTKNFHFLKS